MPDSLSILQEIAATGSGRLALIVERSGSAPRGVGAMLLLKADGNCNGTVGGGSLEQQIVEALQQIQRDGEAYTRLFQLVPERDGMSCGGRLTVLLTKLSYDAIPAFAAATASLEAGRGCILQVGLVDNGQACWSVETPLADTLQRYSIPLQPAPDLLICGAGHIGQALASMALTAGFKVKVLDDRAKMLVADCFSDPVESVLISSFKDCLKYQQITPASFVLIATYDHQYDQIVLEQALATDAGYIGMVGSRRKREELFGHLCIKGMTEADLSRVRCPVGVAIGAETPAEIAVSILAEMIAVQRGKNL